MEMAQETRRRAIQQSKIGPIIISLLTVLLVAVSMVGTPLPVTPPHPPATQAVLWSQSQAPVSVELCMPEALRSMLLTEVSLGSAIDLRVPEALLRHVYGAGQVSKLEKSPAP
jgi:hypothetical protein